MILLWGLPPDGPLIRVRSVLMHRGLDVVTVDQRRILSVRSDNDPLHLRLRVPGPEGTTRSIALNNVASAYLRPYDVAPVLSARYAVVPGVASRHAFGVEAALCSWASSTSALLVNPIEAAATNGTKPLQVRLAADLGFAVPESLLTTDADAARDFAGRHGDVVYKAIGGTRTIAGLLRVEDTARMARFSTGPVHLQRFVRGTNMRVHVVGDRLWGTEIDGQHTDWRQPAAGDTADLHPTPVPGDVAERCVLLTKTLGLHLSGIDFVRDTDGRWVFLEANTSPAFTAFPRADEVAEAIADVLASPHAAAPLP